MNIDLLKDIERLYYDEKMSIRQVAKALNCENQKVRSILKNLHGARDYKEALKLRSTPEYSEKLRAKQLGELNNSAKLTAEKVLLIRKEYEELLEDSSGKYQSQNKLAKKYGVKRSTISDVVLYRTWKHI